jgi:predicted nucleic acid-binding protein
VKRVLIDTGPLVAIFLPGDHRHKACIEALHSLPSPLLTCWPVVTEAFWLLRHAPAAVQQMLGSIGTSFLDLLPLNGTEAGSIAKLMMRYEDIHPQLADACLVYLAHREEIETVFTLDHRDFSIYRTARKRPFEIVPPSSGSIDT